MPHKPARPCNYPGCPHTTTRKSGYCLTHEKLVNKQFEATREKAIQRGYTSRWRKARDLFLANNPLCVLCSKEGRTTSATVVDHIMPHKGDESLFWDESNWQALCKRCHDKKTAKQDGAFKPKKYRAPYSTW